MYKDNQMPIEGYIPTRDPNIWTHTITGEITSEPPTAPTTVCVSKKLERYLTKYLGTSSNLIFSSYNLKPQVVFEQLTTLHDPDRPMIILDLDKTWVTSVISHMLKTPAYQKIDWGNKVGLRVRHVMVLTDRVLDVETPMLTSYDTPPSPSNYTRKPNLAMLPHIPTPNLLTCKV